MFRSILVPLDGTRFGERGLPLASAVAKAAGAVLHLAHVHIPYEPETLIGVGSIWEEDDDVDEHDEKRREEEEEYLDGVRRRIARDGITVETAVLGSGSVVEELVAHADRVEADLVVITSHAYRGLERAWHGSTADGMLHHSDVPLLVAHPPEDGPEDRDASTLAHVMVPLDGSALAESVLPTVVDLAIATKARVTVLRVLTPTDLASRILPGGVGGADEDEATAGDYLDRAVSSLREAGLQANSYLLRGKSPARTIVATAEDRGVDVIAMATHGRGGLLGAFTGSVADAVLHTTRLPVLLRRPSVTP